MIHSYSFHLSPSTYPPLLCAAPQRVGLGISKEPGGTNREEVGEGLSAEVAALVHAAKAKEWTPEASGLGDGIRDGDGKGSPQYTPFL